MSTQWYVYKNNQQMGPFSREELDRQVIEGKIEPQDKVWTEGMSDWNAAENVEGLLPEIETSSPPPPPSVGPTAAPPPPPVAPVGVKGQSGSASPQSPGHSIPSYPVKKKISGLKVAAIIGGSLLVLFIILVAVILSSVRSTLRSSEVYEQAMAALQTNPQAVATLGEPVEAGNSVNGEINISNGSGDAQISIPVSGSLSKGDLTVTGVRTFGQWSLSSAVLVTENGAIIDLQESGLDFGQPGSVTATVHDMLTFNEPGYGFTMNYPQNWFYNIQDNSIFFYGPEETEEGENMVVVQILANASAGGQYANLEALYADLEDQYIKLNGSIFESDSGVEYIGESEHAYIMLGALYPLDGDNVLEVAVIIQRDENYFYLLIYTAPLEISDKYSDLIFDQILDSFRFVAF